MPGSSLAVSSPFTSTLAVQSMFKSIATINEVDGRFVISDDEGILRETQKGFRRDAEVQYFHLLENRAEEIGLSQAGLKILIREHLTSILDAERGDRKSIAMTGITGELGNTLSRSLLKQGHPLTALVRDGSRGKLSDMIGSADTGQIKIEDGNLFSIKKLEAMISGCDVFYHFAGIVGRDVGKREEEHPAILATNGFVVGLMDRMIKEQKREDTVRFIYPSSYVVGSIADREDVQKWISLAVESFDAFMGTRTLGDNTESELMDFSRRFSQEIPIPKGVNPYSISKLLGETFARRMKNSFNVRIGSVYGPGCNIHNRIYGLISNRLRNENMGVFDEALDNVYIEDAIEVLAKLAGESTPPRDFNLVTGELTSLKYAISQIKEMTPGYKGDFTFLGPRHETPLSDGKAARQLLGRDFTPFSVGLPLTVNSVAKLSGKAVKSAPSPGNVLIEAHSGKTDTREGANTKETVLKALRDPRVDVIELDVQMTKDNRLVLAHGSFKGVATPDGNKFISELTTGDIRRYGLSIPLFDEILDEFRRSPRKMLNVDVKEFGRSPEDAPLIAEKLLELLNDKGVKDRVFVVAFCYEILTEIRKRDKDIRLNYCGKGEPGKAVKPIRSDTLDKDIENAKAIDATLISLAHANYEPAEFDDLINALSERGQRFYLNIIKFQESLPEGFIEKLREKGLAIVSTEHNKIFDELVTIKRQQVADLRVIDAEDTEKMIILDLDDTLYDSRRFDVGKIERNIFYEVYAEVLGVSLEEGKRAFKTKKAELGLRGYAQIAIRLGIAEEVIKRSALLEVSRHIEEDRDLQSILRHLKRKGYTLAVLTNSTKDAAERKIAQLGIGQYLDGVFSAFELGMPKPNTEVFVKVSTEMGFSPERTICVGNSLENDIKPAQQAGMRTIHIERPDRIYELEKMVEEKRNEMAMDAECDRGQTFIDTLRIRAKEAKDNGQNIVIGIDTSWMPEDQFTRDLGLQQLINKIASLKEKGLGNIIVVRENDGKRLAGSLAALAENKEKNPLSNMIILGSSEVLRRDDFDVLRSDSDPKKWAFFAEIVLPEGFPQNNYIRLIEMLNISVNLAFGKTGLLASSSIRVVQEGERIYHFIPKIEPCDYSILEKTYRGQLKSLQAA